MSFRDVRDRMICFALLYDFALRRNEAAALTIDDVTVADLVQVLLKSDYQKGTGKAEVALYSCFPASIALVHRYLELRFRMGRGGSDGFLVTEPGNPWDHRELPAQSSHSAPSSASSPTRERNQPHIDFDIRLEL